MIYSLRRVSSGNTEKNSLLTPAQRVFNLLNEKIKELKDQQKTMVGDLDALLLVYHEEIKPVESLLCNLFIERIKIGYQHCKNSTKFSKIERGLFKEWILTEINRVETMVDSFEIDPVIKGIFKDLSGVCYDEKTSADFESMKDILTDKWRDMGVEVDFSTIDCKGSREEIQDAFFNAIGKAVQNKKREYEHAQKEKKKTKKQIKEDAKTRAYKEIQLQSINTVYKRLVKALHPDLEQDTNERSKKEEFMKRLTSAYDSKNLFEILAIELEWLNSSIKSPLEQSLHNDEQIKMYNSLLREQIKELEALNKMLPAYPRYTVLHRFYGMDSYHVVKDNFDTVHEQLNEMQLQMNELHTDKVTDFFKEIIEEPQHVIGFRSMAREIFQFQK